jgi:hypothetical protein
VKDLFPDFVHEPLPRLTLLLEEFADNHGVKCARQLATTTLFHEVFHLFDIIGSQNVAATYSDFFVFRHLVRRTRF